MSAIERYPQPELRDRVRTGADFGIALIPGVGGALQVLVDAVMMPSLAKRRDVWLGKVGELLVELDEKCTGFDPAQLAGDEVFVTAISDASRIAMGTHLEEKLDLLKNCLAHLVLAQDRDDFMILQMFRFVELLSPEHILILQYLSNPKAWFDGKGIVRPLPSVESLALTHADLPVSGDALSIVLRDLSSRGLILADITESDIGHEPWRNWSTDLGDTLLQFVRDI